MRCWLLVTSCGSCRWSANSMKWSMLSVSRRATKRSLAAPRPGSHVKVKGHMMRIVKYCEHLWNVVNMCAINCNKILSCWGCGWAPVWAKGKAVHKLLLGFWETVCHQTTPDLLSEGQSEVRFNAGKPSPFERQVCGRFSCKILYAWRLSPSWVMTLRETPLVGLPGEQRWINNDGNQQQI